MKEWQKSSAAFALTAALALITGILIVSYQTYQRQRAEVRRSIGRELLTIARAAAADLDGDRFTRLFVQKVPPANARQFSEFMAGVKVRPAFEQIQHKLERHVAIHRSGGFGSGSLDTFVRDPFEPERYVRWAALANNESRTGEPFLAPRELTEVFNGSKSAAISAPYVSPYSGRRWMAAYVPITNSEGEVVGVLGAAIEVEYFLKEARRREQDTLVLLLAVLAVGLVSTAALLFYTGRLRSNRRQLEKEIARRREAQARTLHEAYYDSLTGLPNRLLLLEKIGAAQQSQRSGGPFFALVILDLHNFSMINDSFGFGTGDVVLKLVADRIQACLPEGDVLARLGDDEFAILLYGEYDEPTISHFIDGMQRFLERPIQVGGREISLWMHLGVCVRGRADGAAEANLLYAETALSRARTRKSGSVEFYQGNMRDENLTSFRTISDLRRALQAPEQFEVHYQPIVSAQSKMVVGFEALVRWRHPEHGLRQPLDFIPMAEQSGLIDAIGEIVLENACEAIGSWLALGHKDVWVSVNISPLQLRHSDLGLEIPATLARHQIAGRHLKIELTESAAMADLSRSIELIEALVEADVRTCIDDFGTGYSCLAYLDQLPLNTLKIDKSFVDRLVHRPTETGVLRGIISMADGLGLRVIAEGVEVQLQREFLTEAGCHELQGYLIGRPVPFERTHSFLTKAP